MARIHCFGVGLVGSYVAKKLFEGGHEVHAYDPNPSAVMDIQGIHIHQLEPHQDPLDILTSKLKDNDTIDFDKDLDFVVNMLPGSIGHISTKGLVQYPWRTVDLSFSEHTPEGLHDEALSNGATILWDTGIAPGLSNMLLSEAYRHLGSLKKCIVRVGGNPINPTSGWNYMAPFSPKDVIAEYTRPARVVRDSKQVSLPALSDRHNIEVQQKGEMEAFLTDGLRSVIHSIPSVEMSEYTVRWPGHIQRFIDERECGNIDEDQLALEWRYDRSIPEFTWMEVNAEGLDGTDMSWTIQDHGGDDGHSMARCTGLVTISCIEEWIRNPKMLPYGVHAPEVLTSEVVTRIMERMASEGVEIMGPNITLLGH